MAGGAAFPANLRGRTAVVSGAGMGMGRTLALRLRREGCHLALCDVDEAALATVAAELRVVGGKGSRDGGRPALRVSTHWCDVGSRDSVRALVAAVQEAHGDQISLLFNNAGIQIQQSWDRMSEGAFDKVMGVNLDGVITMTRLFWPMLVASDAAYVVNTSSIAGFIPPAGGICTPYVVSKYAVRGFSEHLMMQCKVIAPHVRVAVVHPGAIHTEIIGKNHHMRPGELDTRFLGRGQRKRLAQMSEQAQVDAAQQRAQWIFSKFGYSAEQASDMIVDGVKRGKTRIMVGWDATIIDIWVRAFPRIFLNDAATALAMGSGVVGRHFVLPAGAVSAAAAGARLALRWYRRSKL